MNATGCSQVAQAFFEVLKADKNALGLADVWMGDQRLIAQVPAACVIVGNTNREYAGAPRRLEATYEVQVLVYHLKLQDVAESELETAQTTEAVVDRMDQAYTLGGLVIDGFVKGVEPGYIQKDQSYYKTSRITWTGFGRVQLPLEES